PALAVALLREVADLEARRRTPDAPRVGLLEPREQAKERRLSGTVRPDEPDPRARRHDEADVREDDLCSVRLRDSGRDERAGKARHAQRPPTTSASNSLLLAWTGPDETGQSRIERRRAPSATLAVRRGDSEHPARPRERDPELGELEAAHQRRPLLRRQPGV